MNMNESIENCTNKPMKPRSTKGTGEWMNGWMNE